MNAFINIQGIFIKEKRILKTALSLWENKGGDVIDAYIISVSEHGQGRKIYSLDKGMDKMSKHRINPK